ncbi:2-nitropropane dioxygenase [Hornefia porci]|uniref:Probable nitronate monooxygenase n=1 Tax=Hornefia porci TaxID=2652292 RepID=A0A1Q9JJN7_9FIRM|nr:nitronate monooxygenase family protein [Hornefia porci]OLR56351.1 2-nitropropane dioxygenase [Hornefia porci]
MKKLLDKLSVPVIQGGMGIGISMGGLAGAVAAEGGMGVISTANIGFREPDFRENPLAANIRALRQEIRKAREIAGGRGLLAVNAMVATTEFAVMVREAVRAGIDAVISGAGLPLTLPEAAGEGALLAPVVSGDRAAALLLKHWERRFQCRPDFVVVEGSEAGGHLGFRKEELLDGTARSLRDTVKAVKQKVGEIPVFAAGGVFSREDIDEIRRAGAAGAQIATRFIATDECDASQAYKDVILAAGEEDAVIIDSPVGMPGRALRTPLIDRIRTQGRIPPRSCMNCIVTCDPGTTKYCISRALIAAYHGDLENGLFFCGSNVGRVNRQVTVHELIKELTK